MVPVEAAVVGLSFQYPFCLRVYSCDPDDETEIKVPVFNRFLGSLLTPFLGFSI
jgi:hypothetical protein